MVSNFSLNSLKILRDLVRFKLYNQKQFKGIYELYDLERLDNKLTKLIDAFNREFTLEKIEELDIK